MPSPYTTDMPLRAGKPWGVGDDRLLSAEGSFWKMLSCEWSKVMSWQEVGRGKHTWS